MSTPAPAPADGTGFWFALWTATKLLVTVGIVAVVAVFALTSTQPTVVPVAVSTATPVGSPATSTPGPTPTALPTIVVPSDTFVPGQLIYVQGRTLYRVHQRDAPGALPPPSGVSQPAASPDGRYLAFVRFQHNYHDLYTLDLRTGKSTLLVHDQPRDPIDPRTGYSAGAPAWSNDGSSIYFPWSYPGAPIPGQSGSFDRSGFSITRCAAAGPCDEGSASTISTPYSQTGGDDEPAPRPLDTDTLVYTKYQYQQTTDNNPRSLGRLVARSLGSGTENPLTPAQASVSQPAWSVNGRYLAYVLLSDDQQSTSIYVMPFHPGGDPQDFTHARLLVRGASFAAHPVFSPDGQYLAYVATSPEDSRFHLYIARVHLGPHSTLEPAQEVHRAGIVDSDRVVWTR